MSGSARRRSVPAASRAGTRGPPGGPAPGPLEGDGAARGLAGPVPRDGGTGPVPVVPLGSPPRHVHAPPARLPATVLRRRCGPGVPKAQQIGSNPDKCSPDVHRPDIDPRSGFRDRPSTDGTSGPRRPVSSPPARAPATRAARLAPVRISARADYALRAAVELAAAGGGPVKLEQLASSQDLPPKFLETILGELRRAGLLRTQRGAGGGGSVGRAPS